MYLTLFIRGRELNISLVLAHNLILLLQKLLDYIQHTIVMKIPNKRELQQIAFNNSSDIDFQDFTNFYKKYTAKPYSFLVIDTTLAPDNFSRFRKNLLERI